MAFRAPLVPKNNVEVTIWIWAYLLNKKDISSNFSTTSSPITWKGQRQTKMQLPYYQVMGIHEGNALTLILSQLYTHPSYLFKISSMQFHKHSLQTVFYQSNTICWSLVVSLSPCSKWSSSHLPFHIYPSTRAEIISTTSHLSISSPTIN